MAVLSRESSAASPSFAVTVAAARCRGVHSPAGRLSLLRSMQHAVQTRPAPLRAPPRRSTSPASSAALSGATPSWSAPSSAPPPRCWPRPPPARRPPPQRWPRRRQPRRRWRRHEGAAPRDAALAAWDCIVPRLAAAAVGLARQRRVQTARHTPAAALPPSTLQACKACLACPRKRSKPAAVVLMCLGPRNGAAAVSRAGSNQRTAARFDVCVYCCAQAPPSLPASAPRGCASALGPPSLAGFGALLPA